MKTISLLLLMMAPAAGQPVAVDADPWVLLVTKTPPRLTQDVYRGYPLQLWAEGPPRGAIGQKFELQVFAYAQFGSWDFPVPAFGQLKQHVRLVVDGSRPRLVWSQPRPVYGRDASGEASLFVVVSWHAGLARAQGLLNTSVPFGLRDGWIYKAEARWGVRAMRRSAASKFLSKGKDRRGITAKK